MEFIETICCKTTKRRVREKITRFCKGKNSNGTIINHVRSIGNFHPHGTTMATSSKTTINKIDGEYPTIIGLQNILSECLCFLKLTYSDNPTSIRLYSIILNDLNKWPGMIHVYNLAKLEKYYFALFSSTRIQVAPNTD